jgi:hypothetical protein
VSEYRTPVRVCVNDLYLYGRLNTFATFAGAHCDKGCGLVSLLEVNYLFENNTVNNLTVNYHVLTVY